MPCHKYMPNAELLTAMLKKSTAEDDSLQSLDWIKRLKIAVGTAEAVSYLHMNAQSLLFTEMSKQAAYFSMINMRCGWEVLAMFLLKKGILIIAESHVSYVCHRLLMLVLLLSALCNSTNLLFIFSTINLSSPVPVVNSDSSRANCAFDVYCFGKVLLELVTGKLGLSASNGAKTKEFLDQTLPYVNVYDKELVTKIVVPLLISDEDLLEEVWAMAIIAWSCLNPKPSRRPPMRYVLEALENPLKIMREENTRSGRLRTTSSRGSWNAALFSSWRISSDVAVVPGSLATKVEGTSKQSGTTGSHGNGNNGSLSHRRHSKEICPEPSNVQDIQRQEQD